jgi:hypothetical protein
MVEKKAATKGCKSVNWKGDLSVANLELTGENLVDYSVNRSDGELVAMTVTLWVDLSVGCWDVRMVARLVDERVALSVDSLVVDWVERSVSIQHHDESNYNQRSIDSRGYPTKDPNQNPLKHHVELFQLQNHILS